MTRKRKLRRRIAKLEAELTAARFGPPPTFETVTVCWTDRTVQFGNRTVQGGESDCLSFPVLKP